MIILKQRNEKWRIVIGDEVWEFNSLELMKHNLDQILEIKKLHGILNNENERRTR